MPPGCCGVGTTGDYTPFGPLQPDGTYAGADIDMAHDLAETLGVRTQFTPTVWVELLGDFLADRLSATRRRRGLQRREAPHYR